MKKLFLLSALIFCGAINAQNVGINTNGATPRDCAILDIVSSSKGILIPQVALTAIGTYAPLTGTQVTGLLVYSTAAPTGGNGSGYYYWTGAQWANLIDNITPGAPWYTSGNAGTSTASNFIGTTDAVGFVVKTNNTSRTAWSSTGYLQHVSGSTSIDATELDAPAGMALQVGALWGVNSAPAGNGTGYGTATLNYSILGAIYGNRQYSFGIAGQSINQNRCAAVFGMGQSSTWGTLGYVASGGGTAYGAYFSAAAGTGGGYLPTSSTSGIGMGVYSDFLGSINKGKVMGQITMGELFASYNIGNEYTAGYKADVVKGNTKKGVAFANSSTELKLYADGSSKLTNGETFVKFDESFLNLIAKDKMPTITVSPMGECNGLYIVNVSETGFTVRELNKGTSNSAFSWIAIGRRLDEVEIPKDIMDENFEENVKNVIVDENITEIEAKPMWWNGSKLIFDTPAPKVISKLKAKEMNRNVLSENK